MIVPRAIQFTDAGALDFNREHGAIFSGGQKQRIAIARTAQAAADPDLR
jgi:ABC-type methionine transport system ATPase subunit